MISSLSDKIVCELDVIDFPESDLKILNNSHSKLHHQNLYPRNILLVHERSFRALNNYIK